MGHWVLAAWVGFNAAGQLSDGLTTSRFTIDAQGHGCYEGNARQVTATGRLDAWQTDMGKVWGAKAATIGMGIGLALAAEHLPVTPKGRRALRWIAGSYNAGAGAVGAYDATRNLALCGW